MCLRQTLVGALALATAIHADADAQAAAGGFSLPAPTGAFGVGTTAWHLTDTNRIEPFSASRVPRQVKVFAWYPMALSPAAGSERKAPYLRESLVEARTFAAAVRAPGVFDGLATVATHSVLDGVLVPGPRRPVLVFSHGYTGLVSAYTALLEDLASHGYIVLSIAHPYEVVATTLSNGSLVTMLDSAGSLRRGIRDVLAEWSVEDSIMALVTRADDDIEQLRILRGYLSGLTNTHAVIDRWVKDTKLVLDDLAAPRASSVPAFLTRASDLTRIGVFGHSMGGVVAGQFCVDDNRCRAGLNLDGIPQSGTMIDATMRRPFLMLYSARPGRLGASDAIYRRAASPYYRVDVSDTRHVDFSDMNFWGGPLRRASGAIDPRRAAELTRLVVRQYFDRELRGMPSPLLSGAVTLPGVRVHRAR